jgi:SAM-dependent methyltransferase
MNWSRLLRFLPSRGRPIPDDASLIAGVLADFVAACARLDAPRVLELGSRRSDPAVSTMHRYYVPHAAEFLGTDLEDGLDVDLVADLHRLTQVTGGEQFDAIISCSTFEHLKYPHLAAHEIMKALRIGGLLFVQTHQTFPLHAAPADYYRFSREGLAGLFGTQMGFQVIATDYEFPCQIHSERNPNLGQYGSFLNVRLYGRKFAPTPDEYSYEL